MSRLSEQTKRDILSFSITLSLYLGLFFLWIYAFQTLTPSLAQPNVNTVTLNLDDFTKETPEDIPIEEKQEETADEPEPVEQEEMQKEEPEKKEPIEVPQPEESPTPKEPEPEPIVEAPPPQPLSEKPKAQVVEKPKIKKRMPKKVAKKKRHTKKKKKSVKRRSSSAPRKARRSGGVGSSRFVARLKAKINAHKSYPRIARKRGMQGSVRVKFRISSTGKLSGLSVSGPRIFLNSARQAVKSAFPLSTRGASLPMTVNLTLNYHLKK